MRAHPAGPRSGELHTDRPAEGAPADLNRLDPAIWPRGASRGDGGVVGLAGADVRELAITYGTPLMVVDEDDFRSRCQESTLQPHHDLAAVAVSILRKVVELSEGKA